jgi:UDP-N-acetylglucosamine diphosphorylase / glucose-1-phosphate thymidylyltransferase / UDP-N-acetylgalactosamine diphosphorylase / glucosamine-1-phosphate N-acetyltransferase / galactosamine-1-phosphate N-acetyltransferase
MLKLTDYLKDADQYCPYLKDYDLPWKITAQATVIIEKMLAELDSDFIIQGNTAIHKTAVIEQGVVLKGPLIISQHCFVAAHAYLRGGVWLAPRVTVGPGCEVKSSFILAHTALAHFNFVGDSLVGSNVNMEAGSILANHYNEREEKEIFVKVDNQLLRTGSQKFGALVGDGCRIGANAVTSPGTLLPPRSVVGRLELVNQASLLTKSING